MSIRVISAAVVTAAGLAFATCEPAIAAPAHAATPLAGVVQLTGTQMLSALLPGSYFPAGYKLDKTGVYDSGKHLETSGAKYDISTMSCSSFSDHFGQTGFGETAIASDDFDFGSADSKSYGQLVYQFKTSGAATAFYSGSHTIFAKCLTAAFAGAPSGAKFNVRVFNAASIGGHRTFQVNESGTVLGYKIDVGLVVTLAGTDVFMTGADGIMAAQPTNPSDRTLMLKLIDRVRAYR